MFGGSWSWGVVLAAGLFGALASQAQPSLPANSVLVPGRPFAVAERDGVLFVPLSGRGGGEGAVAVLRQQGGMFAVDHLVTIGGLPGGLALSPDGRMLAVADGRRTVLLETARVLSGEGDPVMARFRGQSAALGVAFSPDGGTLAITEERANQVTLVSPGHPDAVPVHIGVGALPVGVTVSPDGHWLYVTSEAANNVGGGPCPADTGPGSVAQGTVSTIDLLAPAGPVLVATAAVGCGAVRIILSGDGAVAFVSLRTDGAVATFSTADLRAGRSRRIATAPVGAAPVGLALSSDGRTLIAANSDRFNPGQPGTLSCLHVETGGRLRDGGRAGSGVFPRGVTALPGGFVAALFGSRALQFLPTTCPTP